MVDAKRAHIVARAIEKEIIESGWPVGESLGVESELANRYGVGRDVMRQAITLVARGGLAVVRRGRDGGVVVAAPTGDAASSALRSYLETSPPAVADLILARRRFDSLVVQLAIERQSEAETDGFHALLTELELQPHGEARDFEAQAFRAICAASRNSYLALVALVLHDLSWSRGYLDTPSASGRDARAVVKLRATQLRAIIAGDLAAGLVSNTAILDACSRLLSRPNARKGEESRRGVGLERERLGGGGKLGEQIAADIKRRVATGEFSPGDRIGSEADLREAYRAGRGAVRDAIRLLEHVSLARSMRGPAGGLYVTAPTADSVLRTIGLYLRASGVGPRALMEVGEVLDPLAAELAANKFNSHAPEEAQRILARLEGMTDAPLRERSLSYYAALSDFAATPLVTLLLPLQASLVEIDPVISAGARASRDLGGRLMSAIEAADQMSARSAMIAIRRGYRFHTPPPQSLGESPVLALLDRTTAGNLAADIPRVNHGPK